MLDLPAGVVEPLSLLAFVARLVRYLAPIPAKSRYPGAKAKVPCTLRTDAKTTSVL